MRLRNLILTEENRVAGGLCIELRSRGLPRRHRPGVHRVEVVAPRNDSDRGGGKE